MQKIDTEGENFQEMGKWTEYIIFMNLKKKLTPVVILTLSCGYIHVYDFCSQTSLLVYTCGSDLRSSGSLSADHICSWDFFIEN